jgi:hypothetical protein
MEVSQLVSISYSDIKKIFELLTESLFKIFSTTINALKNSFTSPPKTLVGRHTRKLEEEPEVADSMTVRIKNFTDDPKIQLMLLAYTTFGHRYPAPASKSFPL